MQTAAASLVAAVPAGILATLLVMVFLSYSENLQTMTQVLVVGTLLCAAVVVLTPFGILVFGGKKPAAAKSQAAADEGASEGELAVEDGDDMQVSGEIDTYEDEGLTEAVAETVDFDSGQIAEIADDTDELSADSEEDIFAEEEEEPPAKKGGKKKNR